MHEDQEDIRAEKEQSSVKEQGVEKGVFKCWIQMCVN